MRTEPRESSQEQQDVVENKVKLAKAAIGVGGLLVGYGYQQHNARGKYLQAVGAMVMSVGVLTLQQVNQWPKSSMRSLTTTSSTSGEKVDDPETISGTSSMAWVLGTSSRGSEEPEDDRPRLRVLRERSRSRDDRDAQPRPPRGAREEDSQEPTEPEEPAMANISNQATGSGGDGGAASASAAAGGAASASAAAERTRRNEEMADLTSESNVAVYGRDSGIAADTVMMEDEEWSVSSGREVEFDLQPGEEDPRVAIAALLGRERMPEENQRRRLEQRRDQAVEEAIRRLGIPERRSGGENQQVDQTPDDPNVVAEVLNTEGTEALNTEGTEAIEPEGAETANLEGEEEGSHDTPLSDLFDRMVEREDEPQAFLVIRDTRTNINGSWLLRPTARRTILTYLMKYPCKGGSG